MQAIRAYSPLEVAVRTNAQNLTATMIEAARESACSVLPRDVFFMSGLAQKLKMAMLESVPTEYSTFDLIQRNYWKLSKQGKTWVARYLMVRAWLTTYAPQIAVF
jgi:hypothetical protein